MPTELQTFPFDYSKDYGEQLACAYHNQQYISEEVCKHICWECDGKLEHGEGRWSKSLTAMFKHDDRYYGIDYDEGLTECQENEYWKQVPKAYKRIQVVRDTYVEVKVEVTDGKTTEQLG